MTSLFKMLPFNFSLKFSLGSEKKRNCLFPLFPLLLFYPYFLLVSLKITPVRIVISFSSSPPPSPQSTYSNSTLISWKAYPGFLGTTLPLSSSFLSTPFYSSDSATTLWIFSFFTYTITPFIFFFFPPLHRFSLFPTSAFIVR